MDACTYEDPERFYSHRRDKEEPAPWQRICSCNSFSIHCRECRRTCRGKVGVIPMEEGLSMQLSTALLLCIIILA